MSIENLGPGDFGRGTKKRLPICFCLDASGSMEGERMECLNEAIRTFVDIMKGNSNASAADVAVVTFGGYVDIDKPFASLSKQDIPVIESRAHSLTPMGGGISAALDLLELRKAGYKERGIKYYQPWLVLITDGKPEGENAVPEMEEAIVRLNALENENKLVVFNIAVGDEVDMNTLARTSIKREAPIRVDEANLNELFQFLGSSSSSVINGNGIQLVPPSEETFETLPEGVEIDLEKWCL
ncbi:MAG: VWA domain-containing protein [Acutalibacteraceae bacterium]|nr:VWA domain-containing protein [Acutalibacteraceae bacterium]